MKQTFDCSGIRTMSSILCLELTKNTLFGEITLIYITQVREIPEGDHLASTIAFTNPTNHLVSEI